MCYIITITVTISSLELGHGIDNDKSMFVVPFQESDSSGDSYGNNATPIQTSTMSSELDCTLQCFTNHQCVSYNWQESGSICELIGEGMGGWENLGIRNGVKYVAMRETKSRVIITYRSFATRMILFCCVL